MSRYKYLCCLPWDNASVQVGDSLAGKNIDGRATLYNRGCCCVVKHGTQSIGDLLIRECSQNGVRKERVEQVRQKRTSGVWLRCRKHPHKLAHRRGDMERQRR